MRRLAFAALALLALLVALPTSASARSPLRLRQITGSTQVPPGQTITLTGRCRRHYVALSGDFTSFSNVVTLRSAPLGRRRWVFGAANISSSSGSFRVEVECARLRPPSSVFTTRLRVTTRRRRITVPGSSTRSLSVRCPRGYLPAGYGAERPGLAGAPARAADIGAFGSLLVRKAKVVRRAWQFALRNNATSPRDARMYARCLKRRQVARRKSTSTARASGTEGEVLRFTFKEVEITRVDLRAGNNDDIMRHCPRRYKAVETGHVFNDEAEVFTSFIELLRTGVWNIFAPSPETVELDLNCLRAGAWSWSQPGMPY